MKPTLSAWLVLAFTVAVGLAAMEAGVRRLAPQRLVQGYVAPDPDLGTYPVADAAWLNTEHQRYWVRTNGAGFRMPDEVDLSPGRRRVLVYGDSFTFGWGLEYEDTYFAALQKSAAVRRPSLQLLNAAVPGFSSGHVKKLMERHIPTMKPAAVVYFLTNNDLMDNATTDPDYQVTAYTFEAGGAVKLTDVKPYRPWKRFLLRYTPYAWLNRNSHLFVAAKDLVKRALRWKTRDLRAAVDDDRTAPAANPPAAAAADASAAPAETGAPPAYTVSLAPANRTEARIAAFVDITIAHMERIADLAERHRLPLLVVWVPGWPELIGDDPDTDEKRLFRLARKRLARLAEGSGRFGFVDTAELPAVEAAKAGQPAFWHPWGHFSRQGAA